MVHLITLEVQKGVRFLSLYFRDFELYAKARETYCFSDSSFLWDAAVGMKVVLSPVLGSLSRNYMEIGFELGYNEEKGIIPSLVLGVEI